MRHIEPNVSPEAGGTLARSFDPDNLHDAYQVIRAVIEDRAGLMQWEVEVRRDFQPVPWSATVEAIMAGLGSPVEVSSAAAPRARSEYFGERLFAENG